MRKIFTIILSVVILTCYMPTLAFAVESPTDISTAQISVIADQIYTGKEIEPTFTVQLQNDEIPASGYNVTYTGTTASTGNIKNNIDVGTVTLTITGKDSYTGTASTTFKIVEKDIKNCAIEPIPAQTVGTDKDSILVKVKDGNTELKKGVDFTVDSGTTVLDGNTLSIKGIGNYKGTNSTSYLGANTLDGYKIETSGTNTFIYDGTQKTVTVRVKKISDNSYLNSDNYNVTFINNVDVTTASNVPKVIVIGKKQYTGVLSETNILTITPKSISSCTVDPIENQTPNSKPVVGIRDGAKILVEGVDYGVNYDNVSTGSVTIYGINNYKDSVGRTFKVATPITSAIVALNSDTFMYDGTGKTPNVTVTLGLKTLVYLRDYKVQYLYNTDVTKNAIVNVIGIGDYAGSIQKKFAITERSLGLCNLSLYSNNIEYNGSPVNPVINISDGYRTLKEGKDYILSHIGNDRVGVARIIATGIGNYTGTISQTYTIKGKNIADCTLSLSQTSFPYTGRLIVPLVTIKNGNNILTKDIDYSVTYKNNLSAGTATAVVTGKGNYYGTKDLYYTIVGKTIQYASVELEKTEYNYDGLAKRPGVIVKDSYQKLTYGIDYTVEYRDNVKAGTASVVVTGKGTYSGSITKTFTIKGYDQTVSTKFTRYTKYPTSNSFNLAASATGDGNGFTYRSSNESVVKVSPLGTVEIVGTGIATITVATTGTTKYDPASKTVTVTVKPNKAVISRAYSPASGKLKVAIKKAPGVTKYQVKYGRNGNYKNFYYKYSTNPNYLTQAKTFKGLDNGKAYFVKVRAYKTMDDGTKVWGNWSKTRKVYVR